MLSSLRSPALMLALILSYSLSYASNGTPFKVALPPYNPVLSSAPAIAAPIVKPVIITDECNNEFVAPPAPIINTYIANEAAPALDDYTAFAKSCEYEQCEVRSNLTSFALNYQGIRYVWGGKNPTGFDCSGFTSFVLSNAGINVSGASRVQATLGNEIDLNSVKPGDLLFFGYRSKKSGTVVKHVSLVYDNNDDGIFVVHATCHNGIYFENVLESEYWMRKFLFARDVISPEFEAQMPE